MSFIIYRRKKKSKEYIKQTMSKPIRDLQGSILNIKNTTVIDSQRNVKCPTLTTNAIFADSISARNPNAGLTINGAFFADNIGVADKILTPSGNIQWGNVDTNIIEGYGISSHIVIGDGAQVCGGSIAIGTGAVSGVLSTAIGSRVFNNNGTFNAPDKTLAYVYSTSVGGGNFGLAGGVAIGMFNVGVDSSVATGLGNYAVYRSVAIGSNNSTSQSRSSIAIGRNAYTSERCDYSVAIGYSAETNYSRSTSENHGSYSVAIGYNAKTKLQNSIAIGSYAKATNTDSVAIGYNAITESDHSIQLGGVTPVTTTGTLAFRQQIVCNETWKTGNIAGVATIDSNGNLNKTTPTQIDALPSNANAHTAGVPLGGLYTVLGADPAVLYIRTQ